MLNHLSPTSLALFEEDSTEFYVRYLSKNRPPRFPQTQPMAAGSAFDAYVKSFLHKSLFGKTDWDEDQVFENQVEEHNRIWAREHGLILFNKYKDSGALWDLLSDLQSASGTPRFEFRLESVIEGVPLVGYPDIHYKNKLDLAILSDWKVNGYCSSYRLSPKPGYCKLRQTGKTSKIHKDCWLVKHRGMMVNMATHMEKIDQIWAQQLAIYGWLCGEPIGGEFVVAIDQLVGSDVRVAEFRNMISAEFQVGVYNRLKHLWDVLNSGHFFREMSLEESIARCEMLDQQGSVFGKEAWFDEMTRGR